MEKDRCKIQGSLQTPLARKNGRGSYSNCGGRNTLLTEDQELGLERIMDSMEAKGMHCRFRMVKSITNFILANAHDDPDSSPSTVGKNWTTNLFKRKTHLKTRVSKPLSFDRKWAHDPNAIS